MSVSAIRVLAPIEQNMASSALTKLPSVDNSMKSYPKRTESAFVPIPSPAKYAGGAFDNSPAPSSLPLPSWRRRGSDTHSSPASPPTFAAPTAMPLPAVVAAPQAQVAPLSMPPMTVSFGGTVADLEQQLIAAGFGNVLNRSSTQQQATIPAAAPPSPTLSRYPQQQSARSAPASPALKQPRPRSSQHKSQTRNGNGRRQDAGAVF